MVPPGSLDDVYIPKHFRISDQDAVMLLRDIGVGDLFTAGAHGLQCTKIPFSYHEDGSKYGHLRGHLSKVNPQWRDEGEYLFVISGPQGYISPAMLADPSDQDVPTYNYVTVHLSGTFTVNNDPDWLKESLRALVEQHDEIWSFDRLDPRKIDKMLPAMVGVEFQIRGIEAKAKMSQNTSSKNVQSIIEALADFGHGEEAAEFMREIALPHALSREALVEQARNQASSPQMGIIDQNH